MPRRSFRDQGALLLLALLAACTNAQPELTDGPLLGAVTDHSITIWGRLDRPGRMRLRWMREGSKPGTQAVRSALAEARTDYTAVVEVSGLQSAARYRYEVDVAGGTSERWKQIDAVDPQRFATLRSPASRGKLRFVVAADIMSHEKARGLDRIRELAPDFTLLLGDNIYLPQVSELETLREHYRAAWAARPMRSLVAQIPTFMIWDDHEIRDNYWKGRRPKRSYTLARQAYEEYQQSHNPAPLRAGELYYVIVAGDVEIFVPDVRSHRDARSVPDGPGKSMLGPVQKRALLDWLAHSKARVRVLASAVTLSPHANSSYDSWNGFTHERDELLDAMAMRSDAPMLVVSGDQHWNALLRIDHASGALRRRFYELVATPLHAPRRSVPQDESEDFIARDDDREVFGVVDVNTAVSPLRVTLTMCDVAKRCRPGQEKAPRSPLDLSGGRETLPYSVTLTPPDFELGPPPPTEAAGPEPGSVAR